MTVLMTALLVCCCVSSTFGASSSAQGRRKKQPRTRNTITLVARVDNSEEVLTPAKEADIRRLLELTTPRATFDRIVSEVIGNLRKTLPPIPDSAWEEVKTMVRTDFTFENIEKLLIPIYTKHFTAREIKGLLAFYQSPVGRKYTRELPLLELETLEVSVQFGTDLRKRILESLRSKGFNVPLA